MNSMITPYGVGEIRDLYGIIVTCFHVSISLNAAVRSLKTLTLFDALKPSVGKGHGSLKLRAPMP
tara:strand:+ start:1844 stop:2038 length:195 start_codon:yes stop_codon:yes gene_type:complete